VYSVGSRTVVAILVEGGFMGNLSRKLLVRHLSKKEYLLETVGYLFFSWLWINERFAVLRGGHLSIMRYVECGLMAACLLKWLMDTYQRSARIGMSYLGAVVFSITAGFAWTSFLVVQMKHVVMLGVIALIVIQQLLLTMLPEARVAAGGPGPGDLFKPR